MLTFFDCLCIISLKEGRNLGVSGGKSIIDAASNPVEIDAISYECTKESNLFAMGKKMISMI